MEALTAILAAAVVDTGRCFCGSICTKIKSTLRFRPNLSTVEKEMKKLTDVRDDVKRQLESAEINGRSATADVKKWLADVEEFVAKVNSVRAAATAHGERLCGCLFRGRERIRLGRQVEKMIEEAETLLKAGRFPDGMVSVNDSAKPVEYIPGPSIEYQTTASKNLAELVKMLEDIKIRRIGVWGMGGVGKTTLVKNLNNMLHGASSNLPFSIVIWITVSKEVDLKRVQKQIADRLKLEMAMEDSIEVTAGRLHQRLEKEKFLLILDDVWDDIDLECLGVPQPEIHSGSKILSTSRFSDVCQRMMTDVEVKVNTLNDEEAWQLFSEKGGEVTGLEHIEPIAKEVARECCGLPLALITVGTAMRGKKRVELWKHALKELKGSVPCISGVKDKVYNSLKWSYDSLEGKHIKACFLYCSLYPEDFPIEVGELLQCWMAEGLIDEQQSFEEIVNNGVFVIETLKDACLLEDGSREGTVKMHDVVRDVAIWIASSLQDEFKHLVRSGIGLNEISEVDFPDNSYRRVSLMNNKIKRLPCFEIQKCSKASTLLLQGNYPLEEVPDMFLQGFQAIKVLNVSGTRIRSLPRRLQCRELRALLLRRCHLLDALVPLGALTRLQVLDLCGTGIWALPTGMENLINLRQVNLSQTRFLITIPAGLVSKWTHLEVLDMTLSGYLWRTREEVAEGQAFFEELLFHKRLSSLSIMFRTIPRLDHEELLTWIGSKRIFQFTIGYSQYRFLSSTRYDQKKVTVNWLIDLRHQWMGWLLIDSTSLVWNDCPDLNLMEECLSLATFGHGRKVDSFVALKSLTITASECSLSPRRERDVPDLLPNLEELSLEDIKSLGSVSELVGRLGLKLSMLKTILVSNCPNMSFLFSLEEGQTLPNLETVKVRRCNQLRILFNSPLFVPPIVLPNVRILELRDLANLWCVSHAGEWPRIEKIHVFHCNCLKRLYFGANGIREIRGEARWWEDLMCVPEETKSSLQQYFKATEQDHFSDLNIDDEYSFIRRCYTPGSP